MPIQNKLLIGTDEAGYGPNLGPLVVTATAWELPMELEPAGLWREFHKVLTDHPERGDSRLFVADSKAVFSSGKSLEDLEVPVLAFLQTLGHNTASMDVLGTSLAGARFVDGYRGEIWNSTPGLTLPRDSSGDHVGEWSETLTVEMQRLQIRLLAARSRILFPKEFNQRTAAAGSKGVVNSEATLELVRSLSDEFCDHRSVFVVCDKHGGRNRYDELISAAFDDQFVFRLEESRESSRYRMGRAEFCFRTHAEELLPVALSSMISKYVREILMHQFNAFWVERIPGLKPTQGYPVDAKRFHDAIAGAVQQLGVPDEVLWRSR